MNIEDSDRAVRLSASLKTLQGEKNAVSYHMGKMGYYAKELGKDFLTANNADTWKAWCAETDSPNPNTLNKNIYLYRIFGEPGLNISLEQWVAIGPRKLDIISNHMTTEIEGREVDGPSWNHNTYLLDNAEALSVSDLLTSLGRENKKHGGTIEGEKEAAGEMEDTPPTPMTPNEYKKLVKAAPCCVCNSIATEHTQIHSHHFPQTRNRTDADHKVIPLCMTCHQECHQDPKEFLWLYKSNIFDWFYRKIVQ